MARNAKPTCRPEVDRLETKDLLSTLTMIRGVAASRPLHLVPMFNIVQQGQFQVSSIPSMTGPGTLQPFGAGGPSVNLVTIPTGGSGANPRFGTLSVLGGSSGVGATTIVSTTATPETTLVSLPQPPSVIGANRYVSFPGNGTTFQAFPQLGGSVLASGELTTASIRSLATAGVTTLA